MSATGPPFLEFGQPPILFRVEGDLVLGRTTSNSHRSIDEHGNLRPRNPWCSSTYGRVDDHLTWAHEETPYMSFSSSWRRVLRRRQWLVDQGAMNVCIIVVDSAKLGWLIDARAAALRLNYRNDNVDRRRQLRYFSDEYLVYGTISADSYVILSVIPGDGDEVTVHDDSLPIRVPSSFWATCNSGDIGNELAIDIYRHTGVFKPRQLVNLLTAMKCG